jgi:formamidopyrimidine-DNA glycosylase
MPELPEVETVARGLRKTILGRRILSVHLGKTDFIDDPAALELHLPGRTIQAVDRYGKFMLLRLSPIAPQSENAPSQNGDSAPAALLVHLGMTGQIGSLPAAQPHAKHTHVVMPLDDSRELRYTDPRRFGRLAYLDQSLLEKELPRFGADPLEISAADFVSQTGSRRARIKALLLDQSFLRGVGNIYADESLWRAKIHPARLASSLSDAQAKALHRALRAVLQKAIAMHGSSISDFLDADGEPGWYQGQHRVYDRESRPCRRCGSTIRRMIVAGRSSYFCPTCQPIPRGLVRQILPLPARHISPPSKKRNAK